MICPSLTCDDDVHPPTPPTTKFLYDPDGNLVDSSENEGKSTDETVDYVLPRDGTWSVLVFGMTAWDDTRGDHNAFDLYSWTVPLADTGALTVESEPDEATKNGFGQINLGWTPASLPDGWSLGVVLHEGKGSTRGATYVSVDKTVDPRTPIIAYQNEKFVDREVTGTGNIDITFGYTGSYTATAHGFVGAEQHTGTIAQGDWLVHRFELTNTAYFETYAPDWFINSEDVDFDLVSAAAPVTQTHMVRDSRSHSSSCSRSPYIVRLVTSISSTRMANLS